jgi:hypothetical protein
MMMQITKPFQKFISFVAIGSSLAYAQVAHAGTKTAEIVIGDIAPKLERDLFERGNSLKLPTLLADAHPHPPINPNVRKRFFCKKIDERSVVWNDGATRATISTRDVLAPSNWTKWGDPNMYILQDEYRRLCRKANKYDPNTGKLTGPPNFINIQTEPR